MSGWIYILYNMNIINKESLPEIDVYHICMMCFFNNIYILLIYLCHRKIWTSIGAC